MTILNQKANSGISDVSVKWGYPHLWPVDFMEHPKIKWMRTGGTPITKRKPPKMSPGTQVGLQLLIPNRNVFKGGPGGPNDVTSFLSKLPWKAAAPRHNPLAAANHLGEFHFPALEENSALEHANCPSRKMPCLWKATRKNTIQTKHAPPTHVCWFMDRFLLVYRQKKCVMFSITQPPT